MEAQAAEKRKQEAEKRQKLTEAMGIDKQFVDNQYKLAGKYKDATQASYNAWKESAIEFETSGSQEARAKMEATRAQFNQALGIGLSVSATATDEINRMNASKGVGYLDTPDSAKQKYSEFTSGRMETKVENGVVMVKEPDGSMVPLSQSVYFKQEQNPYNSFALDKIDPNIKFVDPVAVAQQDAKNIYTLAGVRIDGTNGTTYNENVAVEKGVAQLKMRYESDPEIKRMIATRWYAQTNGLDKNRLGFADSTEIERRMKEEPAFMEAALQDFEKTYSEAIKSQRPSAQVTGGGGGSKSKPTKAELEVAGVIRTSKIETVTDKITGKQRKAASFALSNNPIRITGEDDLYLTDLSIAPNGTIVSYRIIKATGPLDMAETKKESYTGTISGEQRRGIESELISRGMYDNMRSIASNIKVPNSDGLADDLGVE